jgi:hypothetical protein
MEDRTPDMKRIENQVGELERLTDALAEAPDSEVVPTLSRAVELLREINAGIEAGLSSAREDSREVEALLDRVNLGAFDEAMGEFEERERDAGGP